MIDRIEAYVEENRERYVGLLKEFLRIRSISTDPSQGAAMREAAEWVRRQLTEAGIEAEVVETGAGAVDGESRNRIHGQCVVRARAQRSHVYFRTGQRVGLGGR